MRGRCSMATPRRDVGRTETLRRKNRLFDLNDRPPHGLRSQSPRIAFSFTSVPTEIGLASEQPVCQTPLSRSVANCRATASPAFRMRVKRQTETCSSMQDDWFVKNPIRRVWLRFKGANERGDYECVCTVCDKSFQCSAKSVKAHEASSRHKERMQQIEAQAIAQLQAQQALVAQLPNLNSQTTAPPSQPLIPTPLSPLDPNVMPMLPLLQQYPANMFTPTTGGLQLNRYVKL